MLTLTFHKHNTTQDENSTLGSLTDGATSSEVLVSNQGQSPSDAAIRNGVVLQMPPPASAFDEALKHLELHNKTSSSAGIVSCKKVLLHVHSFCLVFLFVCHSNIFLLTRWRDDLKWRRTDLHLLRDCVHRKAHVQTDAHASPHPIRIAYPLTRSRAAARRLVFIPL